MKNHLITFADKSFYKTQNFCIKKAREFNRFETIEAYKPCDIDNEFRVINHDILIEKRGAGYWLWKPYFIHKKLKELNFGDKLFYCDAGTFFIRDPLTLLELTEKYGTDVICFELDDEKKESMYTKFDCFNALNCNEDRYIHTPQRLASYMIIKKTIKSLEFSELFLRYCQNKYTLTDLPNRHNQSNYKNFITHRHDQSVFSLLSKRFGIKPFRDPSQWGNNYKTKYPNSNYDQIIMHTRYRRKSISERLYNLINYFLCKNNKN